MPRYPTELGCIAQQLLAAHSFKNYQGVSMGMLIRVASIATLAGMVLLAPAQNTPTPPAAARGFTIEQLSEVALTGVPGLEGYKLRMRRITAAPGGAAPEHSHKGRPAMIYVLQGRFIDHRNGVSKEYGVGPGWPEDEGTTHWVENRGSEPAVQLSVDVVKAE
jgi:quercetin dioxygenase-like cupin family protein